MTAQGGEGGVDLERHYWSLVCIEAGEAAKVVKCTGQPLTTNNFLA